MWPLNGQFIHPNESKNESCEDWTLSFYVRKCEKKSSHGWLVFLILLQVIFSKRNILCYPSRERVVRTEQLKSSNLFLASIEDYPLFTQL